MGKILEFKDWIKDPGVRTVSRHRDEDLGITVGLSKYEPGAVHDHYHYHKKRETVYIALQGSGILKLNGVEHQFKANTVAFIPPGDKHGVIRVGEEGFMMVEIVKPLISDDSFPVEE